MHSSGDFSYPRNDDNVLNIKTEKDYEKIIGIARKEIGVVERTGRNDGKRIAEYLNYVGIKEAAPWCVAYVSWVFGQAGYKTPRTAWSPALFPKNRVVGYSSRGLSSLRFLRDDGKGLVYGIYYASLKRVGHCGVVTEIRNDWVTGCEGNTNVQGNREGQGVNERIRHRRTIHRFADWLHN